MLTMRRRWTSDACWSGYVPHKGGRGSLDLGLQLAHILGQSLTVVTVVPRQWSTPSLAKVDAEYAEFARQLAEQSEAKAREYLLDPSVDVAIDYRAVPGRSVTSALLEAAEDCGASLLVLGSSHRRRRRPDRRRLDHRQAAARRRRSRWPSARAGYRSTAADGFSRITCAFSDADESEKVVAQAVQLGRRLRRADPGGELRNPRGDDVPPGGRAVGRGLGAGLLAGAGVRRHRAGCGWTGSSTRTPRR